MGAAFALPGLTGSLAGFGAAMFAVALASGLVDVIANARTAEAEARRGRPLMSAAHAAFSLSYAAAALSTGLAREAGAPPWAVLGVAGTAILLLAALAPSAAPEAAAPVTAGGRARMPGAVLLCGAVVLLAFQIEGSVEQWSALHVERTLGGGAAEGALGPVALGLTMGIGRLAGQGLAGRFGRLPLIAGGAALTAAGAWVAAAAAVPAAAYAGFAMLGLGLSIIGPLAIAEAGARAPAGGRARAVARAAVIGYAGFFIGPPLMGLVAGAVSLPAAIAMLGALALLAGALALGLRRL